MIKQRQKEQDCNINTNGKCMIETNGSLNRNDFASWEHMTTKSKPIQIDYPRWEQVATWVLYCLVTCVQNHILGYIRDVKTSKEAWDNYCLETCVHAQLHRVWSVGKPQKYFHCQHDCWNAIYLARSQQFLIKRYVCFGLRIEDKIFVWPTNLKLHNPWWWNLWKYV